MWKTWIRCGYVRGLSLLVAVVSPAAGQEIIDLGVLEPLVTLRIGDDPLVSVGVEGSLEHELFQVRGAVTLSDGRVAVLNAGTNELRTFSRDGRHLRSWGRTGGGPGEFRAADRLFRTRGDSLVVWDARAGRASVFSADGGFIRAITLVPSPPAARLESVDEQGRLLVVAMRLGPSADPDIRRISEDVFLHGPDGVRIDSIGEAPGLSGVIRSSDDRVEVLRPLISPTTTYALGTDLLWIETGEDRRLTVLDLSSGTTRLLTWQGHDLTMTDAYVEAIIRKRLEGIDDPERRSALRSSLESRPVPGSVPATERVILDPAGRAWVELSPVPGADAAAEWVIVRADGTLTARVDVPRGMELLSISGSEVVVLERGAYDVEQVHVYALQSGGSR